MDWAVVLTTSGERGLSDADISSIAEALGPEQGNVRRIGRAAAEVLCRHHPDVTKLRSAHRGIDVNAIACHQRRKSILIADMDSTVIPVECIDEIADFAGVKPQVAEITERAMAGELDFEGALRARLALIRGLPEKALEEVYAERIRLNPGARILARTMAANGAYTALVSGGFTFFTERVARAAGFAEHRANRLLFADGVLSGGVADPMLGRAAKLEALVEIARGRGVEPAAAIAVGDGANDISMIEAAGLGVAYHAKPKLEAAAHAIIRNADLTALLFLQGYSEDEFCHD